MPTQHKKLQIQTIMTESGVGFGTSGARGLADAMTDRICYTYTVAFLQHLAASNQLGQQMYVAIGGDLRPSTPRIMHAVAKAVTDNGFTVVNCGLLPSPAIALYGIERRIPSIMVTGSHIPDDRNGIKFNTPAGEILKQDEASMRLQEVDIPEDIFNNNGQFKACYPMPDQTEAAKTSYINRYLHIFPPGCLEGMRIGVYEHSGVARDILGAVVASLGATVVPLGRSDTFVPVDTEAIRYEDIALAKQWATEHGLDCIISTDGDADRPLISDEAGNWLRGDIAGVLCAKYLGIRQVATPVSCNSAVERCGWFDRVVRTRIGSPYVIDAMQQLSSEGGRSIAGYEANGGFLTGDQIAVGNSSLGPLPTRDALIVILSILLFSREQKMAVSQLLNLLPKRYTFSNRLKNFPTDTSKRILRQFTPNDGNNLSCINETFGMHFGTAKGIDQTDGLRISFESGEIVHFRPSGNAPELRCYTEADSEERAAEMNRISLDALARLI